MKTHTRIPALLLLAAAVGLSGCTSGPPNVSASPTGPVTLSMAHIDGEPEGDPGTQWFANKVIELSGGKLQVVPKLGCCGDFQDQNESNLVHMVAHGTFPIGWVGTRVFAGLGDTDLQAFTLPGALTTYATEKAVAADPTIRKAAFAHLADMKLHGISLMPGFLRYPQSRTQPLADPAAWKGQRIYAFPGGSSVETIAALGGTPVSGTYDSERRDQMLATGQLDGIEQGLDYPASNTALIKYVIANEVLWPRFSALVANPKAWAGLTAEQRKWITDAAAATVARTDELGQKNAQAAAYLCSNQVSVLNATDQQVAAMTSTTAFVVDKGVRDATTKAIVQRIQALKAADPPTSVPKPCGG